MNAILIVFPGNPYCHNMEIVSLGLPFNLMAFCFDMPMSLEVILRCVLGLTLKQVSGHIVTLKLQSNAIGDAGAVALASALMYHGSW